MKVQYLLQPQTAVLWIGMDWYIAALPLLQALLHGALPTHFLTNRGARTARSVPLIVSNGVEKPQGRHPASRKPEDWLPTVTTSTKLGVIRDMIAAHCWLMSARKFCWTRKSCRIVELKRYSTVVVPSFRRQVTGQMERPHPLYNIRVDELHNSSAGLCLAAE